MHPLDEVAGRERPHARGVPGEVGVVEEVAPLAARTAAEERGGIDPVLRTAAGDGRTGLAAHRLERRRLDQAGPPVLVDVDAQARGQLPQLDESYSCYTADQSEPSVEPGRPANADESMQAKVAGGRKRVARRAPSRAMKRLVALSAGQ